MVERDSLEAVGDVRCQYKRVGVENDVLTFTS